MKKKETHSWAIDSIEEHVASVEVDGKVMANVPQWLLPPAAKEGERLAVEHEVSEDGLTSRLVVRVDAEGTRKAREQSTAQPPRTGKEKRDPGGDIKF